VSSWLGPIHVLVRVVQLFIAAMTRPLSRVSACICRRFLCSAYWLARVHPSSSAQPISTTIHSLLHRTHSLIPSQSWTSSSTVRTPSPRLPTHHTTQTDPCYRPSLASTPPRSSSDNHTHTPFWNLSFFDKISIERNHVVEKQRALQVRLLSCIEERRRGGGVPNTGKC
jgi:hypothetical protein